MRDQDAQDRASWLVERELVSSVGWFIRVRWFPALALAVLPWPASYIPGLRVHALPLSFCGLLLLAGNTYLFFLQKKIRARPQGDDGARRQVQAARALLFGQVVLDWTATLTALHWTGGVDSPLLLLFLVHLVLAAVLYEKREAWTLSGLALLLVAGLAAARRLGILGWHPLIPGLPPASALQDALTLSAFGLVTFSITWLATALSSRFRKRERVILALGENLEMAFTRTQALYSLARATSSTLDLDELLNLLTERVARTIGSRACIIHLVDPETGELKFAAGFGIDPDKPSPEVDLKASGLARRVLAGKSVFLENLPNIDDSWARKLAARGWCSLAAAPARGKKGVTGVIWALCLRTARLGPEDASFLEAAGIHAGIALENALAWRAMRDLDEAKSSFVRLVTHELRSPIAVVLSLLRTLTGGYAGKLEEKQMDLLLRAQNRAEFLSTLVDDLLALAEGKTLPEAQGPKEAVDAAAALQRVKERFEIPAKEKKQQFTVLVEGEGPFLVPGTQGSMDRILDNLVSNAVKYTPEGGKVSIRLRGEGDRVLLEVEDTGIGIPRESLQKLGSEFYRAPNARRIEPSGTGLGLAIVKSLLEAVGAELSIQSEEGKGTRFTVRFPRAAAPEPAPRD